MSRLLWILISALLCSSSWAMDINLSGVVVATPCTIDTNTQNKLVQFDQLNSRHLVAAGSAGDWKEFQLLLTDCPESTNKATVMFNGVESNDDTTAFANAGSAGSVALRLMDSNHLTAYGNGSSLTVDVASDRTATFPMSARIFTPLGSVTAGSFSSTVNVAFTYQ